MKVLTYRERERLLAHAASFIGIMENPPGSNRGKWIDEWQRQTNGTVGYPWCAAFAFSVCRDCGVDLEHLRNPAAVLSWVQWAGATARRRVKPSGGFLVAYSWHGADPHPGDHIGFVEKVLTAPLPFGWTRVYLRTIEGNTGDGVRRRWRLVRRDAVAFIQP